jgi:hypothetical protein
MCCYVVECALKACICKRTNQFDFHPSPEESRAAWSHDFEKLIKAAGLGREFQAARAADEDLNIDWDYVGKGWSPDSRYERRTQREARALLAAVADPDHGVFSCIKRFW